VIGIEDGPLDNNRLRFAVKIKSSIPARAKIGVGVLGDRMAGEVKGGMSMVNGVSLTWSRPAGGRQGSWSSGGDHDVRSSA
jgi:hypothetical protein